MERACELHQPTHRRSFHGASRFAVSPSGRRMVSNTLDKILIAELRWAETLTAMVKSPASCQALVPVLPGIQDDILSRGCVPSWNKSFPYRQFPEARS